MSEAFPTMTNPRGFYQDKVTCNTRLSNYASVHCHVKLRLVLCCAYTIFSHSSALASTSGYCSRELKRDSKVIYWPNLPRPRIGILNKKRKNSNTLHLPPPPSPSCLTLITSHFWFTAAKQVRCLTVWVLSKVSKKSRRYSPTKT